MGGYGSGWQGDVKRTVEDCLVLSAATLMRNKTLVPGACRSESLIWSLESTGEKISSIGFDVDIGMEDGTAKLYYTMDDGGEKMAYRVRLTSTPLPWGGRRWWFVCPLAVDGRTCRRRVGKLYLPPGSRYFGCRQCHDLTYTSCQESHKFDAALAVVGAPWGLSGSEVVRILAGEEGEPFS